MITTISTLPPQITQQFNRWLLDQLGAILHHVKTVIIPLSNRKIRECDMGKRREFDKLLKEFYEVYESKQNEKTEYEAEIKEKTKKGSGFPVTGKTVRFKKIQREESIT